MGQQKLGCSKQICTRHGSQPNSDHSLKQEAIARQKEKILLGKDSNEASLDQATLHQIAKGSNIPRKNEHQSHHTVGGHRMSLLAVPSKKPLQPSILDALDNSTSGEESRRRKDEETKTLSSANTGVGKGGSKKDERFQSGNLSNIRKIAMFHHVKKLMNNMNVQAPGGLNLDFEINSAMKVDFSDHEN